MTKTESIQSLLRKVCNRLRVAQSNIFDKSKIRKHIDARHMFFYICKQNNINIHYIQEYANDKYDQYIDHSTIIYAQNKMAEKVDGDSDWRNLYNEITNK